MAAPTKKRVVDELSTEEDEDVEISDQGDSDSSLGTEEDDDDGQEFINQEIMVEFEARNMDDGDFHGIKKLLAQLFLKANVDLSDLANTLISQNYIGSVIKQVEPEDEDNDDDMDIDDDSGGGQVFGVISVINITEKKNLKCVTDIKSMLLDRCHKCAHREQLATLLHSDVNSVGLIINERFINIPAQISLPSFQSLWKDIEKAKQKKMNYNFTHYIMISKVYNLPVKVRGQSDIKSFINGEEEYFYNLSQFNCEYSVKGERDSVAIGTWDEDGDEMQPTRVVMVIDVAQVPQIMDKLKEVYG